MFTKLVAYLISDPIYTSIDNASQLPPVLRESGGATPPLPARLKRLCPPRRAMGKILLLMKLITVLLTTAILQVSASSFAQKITLSEKNKPLAEVLEQIRTQTGYDFLFKTESLKQVKNVTISVKNAELRDVLDQLLNDQHLEYVIDDKSVIISRKTPSFLERLVDRIVAFDIRGRVMDSEGNPLSGATVRVKNTSQVATTDVKGDFYLKGVTKDDILVISFVGFSQKEVKVTTNQNLIKLDVATSKLDEVQVLAYGGATSRRLSTGSVSRITSEDIAKNPVTNVLQALAGRTTGMSISQANGLAGGDVFFQVRGQNSINASDYTSAPLVVIDGVPYPSAPVNLPDNTGGDNSIIAPFGYGSSLYNLNPGDIESIDILKDADATAIYGSRAANGVMLITTKKGKVGKTKIDVNIYTGIAMDTRKVGLLSTPEYLALRREAFKNDGTTPTATSAPDLFTWDSNRNTDWQKELLGNTARATDANVTMSGGAGSTSFLISGNYHQENTIYPDRRGSNKGGAHFSLNHLSNSGKLNIMLSGIVNTTSTKLPDGPYGNFAYILPPNFQPYDSAGNLKWDWPTGNPYGTMKTSSFNKSFSLTSNLLLGYKLLQGLDAKISIGYTRVEGEQQLIYPKSSVDPANNLFQSSNSFNTTRNQTQNVEPQLQYTGNIAKGKLSVMAGGTIMKTIGEMPYYVNASGFSSDAYINNIALASTITTSTGYSAYQYASLFGRANYNWDNKYIINGSFRRDGSSRFGPDRRFGNFGAIGAAWLFSNELFAKNLSFLSFGKLRGSMGWVGSDNVPNYRYISTYNATAYPYGASPGLVPAQLENPDFGWETTSKLEGAMELGFLKDRVLLSASWYRNRTGNQLVNYPVSTQSGFPAYTTNLNSAVVQNTGLEFELNTINVQNQNFKWTTAFNMTVPRNKLLKFDGIEKTGYAGSMVVGKPLTAIYAVHFTGVDPTGKPTYEDLNKNGIIDYFGGLAAYGKGDRGYVGNAQANAFGGLSNSISYKSFQLDFMFQYTLGLKKQSFLASASQPGNFGNLPRKVLEEYRNSGLDKTFISQSFSSDWFYYTYTSDAVYMNASFIRLNNVALSYSLTADVLRKLNLAGARLYLQAQNVFVISNYDGFDPESGATAVPPLFRIVLGVQCSF
ncbi:SusC/RagA family TonB-linked outer membrane protein [Mucilaginibacter dorajii]|nr:SusC/RagA family TonB-linked outer membrane protein [Mucilaginibacter dorajii]MCS3732305.1 TonB-linked SusC/RagA family outer membrane protein [Mucilaginibacter dorajii]